MGLADFGSGLIKGSGSRPPLEGLYVYLLALLAGFVIADLSVLHIRPSMLPTKAPPSRPQQAKRQIVKTPADYAVITQRNIFNSDGKIPPALSQEGEQERPMEEGPAVPSQLPLSLLGTIVHLNPQKSIGTVNVKSRNETLPFSVGEEIENLAKITKIERRRMVFRNLNNNRLEFIEIPKDSKITFGMDKPSGGEKEDNIAQRGDFSFAVSRKDLEKYTSDLSSILSQARMVPNIVPGSGGKVDGFRFVSIQPGSIYEKLGFKPMDVIKGVNGEPVNSPTKAMELYNALKSEDRVALTIERNGREEEFRYDITE